MTPPGTVTIEDAVGVVTTLTPCIVRPEEVEIDATPYRAPYGVDWRVVGSQRAGPRAYRLTHEVWNPTTGLPGSSQAAFTLAQRVQDAALIDTPLGEFVPLAALDWVARPTPLGYSVEVLFAVRSLTPTVLRFLAGPVWQLR